MRYNIKQILDIPGESLRISGTLDLSWVKRQGASLFPDALAVGGVVENRAGIVTLRYQIDGLLHFCCARCQMQSERPLHEEFVHTVVRSLEDMSLDDVFLTAPDGELSFDEIASDDLQLSLPQTFLCKEDCKGLCPLCGADLNQTTCGCQPETGDPRLAILKQLLQKES